MGKAEKSEQPLRDPTCSFGFVMQDVARLMRRNFNRRIQEQELGLTQAQWQALAHISVREGMSQAALAEILEAQPITVARMIDRMEAAGWVERRPDPDDRRAVRLYKMPKAEPILNQMWDLAAETRGAATEGISEKEKELLLDILQRMRKNLCEGS
ncbi:MAG: MarR family transcriptional regulator [Chloroflexi bacterium]|nr:MarR family transcriptional regulator [Chloroflexota bacterium]